jgi:hypothetical protein
MTAHALLQSRQVPLEQILLGALALVAVVVVGLVVVSRVRKRLTAADDQPGAGGGFMLSDLRRMHKEGQISDEEFERAKARVIDAAKRAAERDTAKADGTSPKDGAGPRL